MAIVRDLALISEHAHERVIDLTGIEPNRPPAGRDLVGLRTRLVLIDATAAAVGWGAAFLPARGAAMPLRVLQVVAAVVVTLGLLHLGHLYQARVASLRAEEVRSMARASLAAMVAGVGVGGWLGERPSALSAVLGWCLAGFLLSWWRGAFAGWLRREREAGRRLRSVLVVGTGEESRSLCDLLLECPEAGFQPIGVVGPVPTVELPLPWVGDVEHLRSEVRISRATGVFICSGVLGGAELHRTIAALHADGVHVHLSSGLDRVHRRRMRIQPVAHHPLLYVEPTTLSSVQLAAKRVFDLTVAALLAVMAAPAVALAALAIKLDDRGPVLFRQRRVGQDGETFDMIKLRTMVPDAESQLDEIECMNARTGPLFKCPEDPRVTRVGRLLRASSIDELPQLLNVLRGEMSMVGPRPALVSEVEQFDDEVLERLRVKPGATGLWQVEAQHKSSFDHYVRLDLFYVENWSVGLDLSILAATVPTVARRALSVLSRDRSDLPAGQVVPIPLRSR